MQLENLSSENKDLSLQLSVICNSISDYQPILQVLDDFEAECSETLKWNDVLEDWRHYLALMKRIEGLKSTIAPDIEIMSKFDAKKMKQQNENAEMLSRINDTESTLNDTKLRLTECTCHLDNAKSLELLKKHQLFELRAEVQNNLRKRQCVDRDSAKMKKFTRIAHAVELLRRGNSAVLGMVCSLCQPSNEVYTRAFLSVLGNRAYTSVVVADRRSGISIAKQLTNESFSDFAIEIASEYSCPNISRPSYPGAILLSSIITVTEPSTLHLFENLFGAWILCNNDVTLEEIQENYKNINVVCLDGRQYLSDGEIRLFNNSFFASSVECSVCWPSVKFQTDCASSTNEGKEEELSAAARILESEIALLRSKVSNLTCEHLSLSNSCSDLERSVKSMKMLIRTLPSCPILNVSKYLESAATFRLLQDSLLAEEEDFRSKFGSLKFQDHFVVKILFQSEHLRRHYSQLEVDQR
jgi:hypothetical protein